MDNPNTRVFDTDVADIDFRELIKNQQSPVVDLKPISEICAREGGVTYFNAEPQLLEVDKDSE